MTGVRSVRSVRLVSAGQSLRYVTAMKYRVIAALAAASCQAAAPPQHPATPVALTTEHTTFRLYKFGQRIGIEHAKLMRGADGSGIVRSTFTFNDRGTDVPLAAEWRLLPGGLASRYQAWGYAARGVSVDDRVELVEPDRVEIEQQDEAPHRAKRPAAYAVTSGYAPVIGQELLVQQWIARSRPARLALLPGGEIEIVSRGKDAFSRNGEIVTLEHLAVFGLVWGREDVWIDDKGQLAALVTRDREFDHFEALRAGNESLLDEVVAKAGEDAVKWLGEAAAKAATASGMFALVGARLVDGTDAAPIEDATVVVDGDRIIAAGPRASTPVPAGARTINVQGATIVPGLWDMHAHLEQVEQAAAYLGAGVTTVRDEGNILPFITAIRDAVDSGRGVGPRVIADCLVDSESKMALGTLRVNEPADIAPLVELAVKSGCAEIKVYSSVKPSLVAPLAAEAHRRGLRVTGHVPNGMDLIDVLDAGFDGVNHVQYVPGVVLPKSKEAMSKLSHAEMNRRMLDVDYASEPMQQLFKRMAKQHTVYDPTIALFELWDHPMSVLEKVEPGITKVPRELRGVFGSGMDPKDVEVNHRVFEKFLDAVRQMHKLGVTIVAGTDIGIPGHSLHRELELYVEAGFTPLEALQSATIVPARVLGKDKELGSVSVGKRADLVVVDGNPLADIHALRKIRLVIAHGRAYDPAVMWKLAGFQP